PLLLVPRQSLAQWSQPPHLTRLHQLRLRCGRLQLAPHPPPPHPQVLQTPGWRLQLLQCSHLVRFRAHTAPAAPASVETVAPPPRPRPPAPAIRRRAALQARQRLVPGRSMPPVARLGRLPAPERPPPRAAPAALPGQAPAARASRPAAGTQPADRPSPR